MDKLQILLERLGQAVSPTSVSPARTDVPPGVSGSGIGKVMGPINRGIYSALVRAGRSVPGTDLLTALAMNEGDKIASLLKGEAPDVNFFKTYPEALRRTKKIGDKIEGMSPVGRDVGRVAGGITAFKGFQNLLPNSTGLTQDMANLLAMSGYKLMRNPELMNPDMMKR